MGDECCGADRGDDDSTSPRTTWIIIGVVMVLGWGGLAAFLLAQ